MKKSELAEHTVFLITEYYNNNIQPFLDALSENCIWIGPAEGQLIQTKKALVAAFAQEDTPLTFTMDNLQVIPVSINATSLAVILTYTVVSYYPNGETTVFRQRTELVWTQENRKDPEGNPCKEYAVRVCHVSNEFPYDAKDRIYPDHFMELDIARLYTGAPALSKAALKGPHGSTLYLSGSSILWVENKGLHTFLHTANQVFESLDTLSDIVEKYPDSLCRIHASYAVNPAFLESIGRFYVVLDDGTRLPIPQKKYTEVKKELRGFMGHKSGSR